MRLSEHQRQEVESITAEYATAPTVAAADDAMKTLHVFLDVIEAPEELRADLATAARIARLGETFAAKSAAAEPITAADIAATGEFLTTAYVAEQLAIDPSRVRRLAAHHGLGRKIGRDWLFTNTEVHELITISTGKAGRPKR